MTEPITTITNNPFFLVLYFLNHIKASGLPNEISQDWLVLIPQNETFEHLLSERGLKAKFMPSTGRYFVEREYTQGKR